MKPRAGCTDAGCDLHEGLFTAVIFVEPEPTARNRAHADPSMARACSSAMIERSSDAGVDVVLHQSPASNLTSISWPTDACRDCWSSAQVRTRAPGPAAGHEGS
jgi:hypothetical protein